MRLSYVVLLGERKVIKKNSGLLCFPTTTSKKKNSCLPCKKNSGLLCFRIILFWRLLFGNRSKKSPQTSRDSSWDDRCELQDGHPHWAGELGGTDFGSNRLVVAVFFFFF